MHYTKSTASMEEALRAMETADTEADEEGEDNTTETVEPTGGRAEYINGELIVEVERRNVTLEDVLQEEAEIDGSDSEEDMSDESA